MQQGSNRRLSNCVISFLQVVKSFLDLKDEQLAVQMDAHDSLWGETGAFLLSVTKIYLSHLFLSVSVVLESRSRAQVLHVRLVLSPFPVNLKQNFYNSAVLCLISNNFVLLK